MLHQAVSKAGVIWKENLGLKKESGVKDIPQHHHGKAAFQDNLLPATSQWQYQDNICILRACLRSHKLGNPKTQDIISGCGNVFLDGNRRDAFAIVSLFGIWRIWMFSAMFASVRTMSLFCHATTPSYQCLGCIQHLAASTQLHLTTKHHQTSSSCWAGVGEISDTEQHKTLLKPGPCKKPVKTFVKTETMMFETPVSGHASVWL